MRLQLGWAVLSSTAIALASCSAESRRGESSGDDAGEGGDAAERGGSSSKGGASVHGGASAAGKGGRSSSAGTSSRSGSSAISGSSGTGAGTPGGGAGGTEPVGTSGAAAAVAQTGGAGGSDDDPIASGGESVGPLQGSCTVPCELELGPTDNLPGESAVVLYDLETNVATLTSDPVANAESQWVIGFSYESDPQHGYGAWATGGWWFAFTEPLEYVEGTYSMRQYVEATSQMVNPTTNQILRVVYSFGEETVLVHAIGVPACDAATSGACASPSDCGPVDGGMLRAATELCSTSCGGAAECVASCVADDEKISLGCSACYADFLGCVSAGCPTECPGQGGSACMVCETDAGCHTAFMACSGLDYMPRGTLTWPLAQPTR